MSSDIRVEYKFAIVPEWVIELEISSTAFKLYALLARYADNQTHRAFPSRETLAERLRCSVKTVERAVAELQEAGAIRKESRGRYQSNVYTLVVAPPKGDKNVPGTKMSDERTKMSKREDKNVALTITTELELENDKVFDQFWATYPRKVGKGAARKAFDKALKTVSAETILAGAERLANDPNKPSAEYLPHAATWLSGERWDDEPYPARQASGGQFVRPPAEGPGRRDWVRSLHEAGEHFACGPGEFGH